MANLTTASTGQYRVGTAFNTGIARQRIAQEFGIDINQLGNLTPDQVRAVSLQTKAMLKQLKLAEVACKEWKKQMEIKAKIERLRKELIEAGLMTAEEIDKTLQEAVLLTGKHQEHMKTIAHATGLELQGIQHKGTLDRQGFEHRFRLKIQKANALHREKLGQATADNQRSTSEGLQAIRDAARLSQEKRREEKAFMAYITGEPNASAPTESSEGQGFGGWVRSWFS